MSYRESYLSVKQRGTKTVELVPTLTLNDRCDRCGAEAKAVIIVRTETIGNTLLLCNHHTNEHEVALISQGAIIYRKEEA